MAKGSSHQPYGSTVEPDVEVRQSCSNLLCAHDRLQWAGARHCPGLAGFSGGGGVGLVLGFEEGTGNGALWARGVAPAPDGANRRITGGAKGEGSWWCRGGDRLGGGKLAVVALRYFWHRAGVDSVSLGVEPGSHRGNWRWLSRLGAWDAAGARCRVGRRRVARAQPDITCPQL